MVDVRSLRVLASVLLLALGGCDEEDRPQDGGVGSGDGGVPAVLGVWQADAGALLDANGVETGELRCTGTMQLRFEADGSFEGGGDPVCVGPTLSGTGTIVAAGRYAVAGRALTFADVTSAGGVTLTTDEGAVAGTLPFQFIGAGTADHEVRGGTLTLTFAGPSSTITQVWTRASE